jgi:hypothetical protein
VDDVTQIAFDHLQHAQAMLDCLGMLCSIFGMEVMTVPTKTARVVVFRSPRTRIPRGAVLQYNGIELPF